MGEDAPGRRACTAGAWLERTAAAGSVPVIAYITWSRVTPSLTALRRSTPSLE
jgi:hypothetical protein